MSETKHSDHHAHSGHHAANAPRRKTLEEITHKTSEQLAQYIMYFCGAVIAFFFVLSWMTGDKKHESPEPKKKAAIECPLHAA